MSKKIGAIIPVYNCESTIQRLLDSIYQQSYLNYEVIIINDGSSDRTKDVIEYFIKSNNCNKKFKLYNMTNGGVSKARNIGLEKVEADYVIFLDSDDWIEREYFNNIIADIRDNDMIVYSYNYFNKGDKKLVSCNSLNLSTKKEFYEELCKCNLFNSLWNKVYKYSKLKNIKFNTAISYGEDCEFVMNYFINISRYQYINKSFYNYDLSTGSLGFKNWDNSFQVKIIGLRTIEKLYDKYNYDKKFLYQGYIKAFVLDISDYIVRKRKRKAELFLYRDECYTFYDIRKIEITGYYVIIKKIFTCNCFLAINIFSHIIMYLKNRKRKVKMNNE